MDANDVERVASFLVSIAALGVGTWFGRHRERAEARQASASATGSLVDAALALLEPYERRIAQLEEVDESRRRTVARLESRIVTLESHVGTLEARLRSTGEQPPPRPRPPHQDYAP